MGFPQMNEFPHDPDNRPNAPHHLYIGLIITWFGFQYIWSTRPKVGAVTVLVGVVTLLDDVLSHVFGVWTPIDWFYNKYVKDKIP